jgi:hypothetical protein
MVFLSASVKIQIVYVIYSILIPFNISLHGSHFKTKANQDYIPFNRIISCNNLV